MSEDPGSLWRNQPEERLQINAQRFVNRRARELESTTRGEIIASIAGAILLIAVIGWRFGLALNRLQMAGFALVSGWIVITAYWFRDQILGRTKPRKDAVAAACLDYYHQQLVLRRDHLRNAWLWMGPITLACILLAVTLAGKGAGDYRRLLNVAPFVCVFALWVIWGMVRRRSEANGLQREIDEMGLPITAAGPK